jgi:hypothetical protein
LLTLGAPFWFNLLKNLMSLRPALAKSRRKTTHKRPRIASRTGYSAFTELESEI